MRRRKRAQCSRASARRAVMATLAAALILPGAHQGDGVLHRVPGVVMASGAEIEVGLAASGAHTPALLAAASKDAASTSSSSTPHPAKHDDPDSFAAAAHTTTTASVDPELIDVGEPLSTTRTPTAAATTVLPEPAGADATVAPSPPAPAAETEESTADTSTDISTVASATSDTETRGVHSAESVTPDVPAPDVAAQADTPPPSTFAQITTDKVREEPAPLVAADPGTSTAIPTPPPPPTTTTTPSSTTKTESVTTTGTAATTAETATTTAPAATALPTTTTPTPPAQRRFNYASNAAGAMVIDSSAGFKHVKHFLTPSSDEYILTACEDRKKYITVSLSEDALVDTLMLVNKERFSSTFNSVQALGSLKFPTKQWVMLGEMFFAKDVRDEQEFQLQHPGWVRYIKLRFRSHHPSEHTLCTLTSFKAYGSTITDGLQGTLDEFNEILASEEQQQQQQQQLQQQQQQAAEAEKTATSGDALTPNTTSDGNAAGNTGKLTTSGDAAPQQSATAAAANGAPSTDIQTTRVLPPKGDERSAASRGQQTSVESQPEKGDVRVDGTGVGVTTTDQDVTHTGAVAETSGKLRSSLAPDNGGETPSGPLVTSEPPATRDVANAGLDADNLPSQEVKSSVAVPETPSDVTSSTSQRASENLPPGSSSQDELMELEPDRSTIMGIDEGTVIVSVGSRDVAATTVPDKNKASTTSTMGDTTENAADKASAQVSPPAANGLRSEDVPSVDPMISIDAMANTIETPPGHDDRHGVLTNNDTPVKSVADETDAESAESVQPGTTSQVITDAPADRDAASSSVSSPTTSLSSKRTVEDASSAADHAVGSAPQDVAVLESTTSTLDDDSGSPASSPPLEKTITAATTTETAEKETAEKETAQKETPPARTSTTVAAGSSTTRSRDTSDVGIHSKEADAHASPPTAVESDTASNAAESAAPPPPVVDNNPSDTATSAAGPPQKVETPNAKSTAPLLPGETEQETQQITTQSGADESSYSSTATDAAKGSVESGDSSKGQGTAPAAKAERSGNASSTPHLKENVIEQEQSEGSQQVARVSETPHPSSSLSTHISSAGSPALPGGTPSVGEKERQDDARMDGTADTSPSAEVVRKAVIEIFDGFSFSKLSTFEDLSTNLETLSLTLPPAPPLRDRSGKADDGTGSTAQRGDARGSAGGMAKRVENVFVQLNQRLKELEEQEAVMRRWTTDATKNYNTALTALRAESIEALRTMHNDVGRTMTKQRAEISAALSALETRIVNVNLLALQSASKARNDAITARTETLEVGLRSARKDVGELKDRLYWLSLASGVMIMVVLSLVMTVVTLQSKSEEYGKREGLRRPGGGDDVPPTPPSNTSKPKRSSKKKKTNSRAKSKGRTR